MNGVIAMEAKSSEVITPEPYFKISFECGLRGVKDDLVAIANRLGVDINDSISENAIMYPQGVGFSPEGDSSQGDLEEIIIYWGDESEEFRKEILAFYNIDPSTVPDDMNIVLSID